MRSLLPATCLAALAFFCGACRILSGEDEEPLFFEITYDDVEWDGSGQAALENGILVIRGEYLDADSSTRYVELRLPDFDGEASYQLNRAAGIYGAVDGDESVPFGYSSGRPDDEVRIDQYDSDEGLIVGAFFFLGAAYEGFDGIPAEGPFTVAGRFRAELVNLPRPEGFALSSAERAMDRSGHLRISDTASYLATTRFACGFSGLR